MSDTQTNPLDAFGQGGAAPPWGITVHKYLPIAAVFFFFNSAGLPPGLFYTALLSPFFYLYLYREGKRWITTKFFICLLPFVVMQVHDGLDSATYYVRSIALLWTVYITVYAFSWALLKLRRIELLFEQLIVMNFYASMLALVVLLTPAKDLLWATDFRGLGMTGDWAPRLQLLTSEPSVYALLMVPLLVFCILRLLNHPTRRNFIYLALIAVPILLSQSFGAITISAAALGGAILFGPGAKAKRSSRVLILIAGAAFLVLLFLVPNPIQERAQQIAAGQDSSTYVRTVAGYAEAYIIAAQRSILWGAGPGQSKLFDDLRTLFSLGFREALMPNAVADTLSSFGFIGVGIMLILEVYLFVRTRVYKSTFRLAIWSFAFLYQFAGGYLTSVQGYLLWCFAFLPIVPALEPSSENV